MEEEEEEEEGCKKEQREETRAGKIAFRMNRMRVEPPCLINAAALLPEMEFKKSINNKNKCRLKTFVLKER